MCPGTRAGLEVQVDRVDVTKSGLVSAEDSLGETRAGMGSVRRKTEDGNTRRAKGATAW